MNKENNIDIGKSVIKGLGEAIDISNRNKFKVTYENARGVELGRVSIQQTLNIIKTLNKKEDDDYIDGSHDIEKLIRKLEEIAERMEHKAEFEVRV